MTCRHERAHSAEAAYTDGQGSRCSRSHTPTSRGEWYALDVDSLPPLTVIDRVAAVVIAVLLFCVTAYAISVIGVWLVLGAVACVAACGFGLYVTVAAVRGTL